MTSVLVGHIVTVNTGRTPPYRALVTRHYWHGGTEVVDVRTPGSKEAHRVSVYQILKVH